MAHTICAVSSLLQPMLSKTLRLPKLMKTKVLTEHETAECENFAGRACNELSSCAAHFLSSNLLALRSVASIYRENKLTKLCV